MLQAEAEAAKRAAALEQPAGPATPPTDHEPSWRTGLAQAQERLAGLAVCADEAAGSVAEADAALAAGEEVLRRWLTASEAARRKLAEWVGRG